MSNKTLTLPDLATGLAKPFGISVSSLTGDSVAVAARGSAQVRLNFVPTETPFEVIEIIERVARHAGALACDGTDGNPVGGGPGATRVAREGARRHRHEGATSAIHGCVAGPSRPSRVSRLSSFAGVRRGRV